MELVLVVIIIVALMKSSSSRSSDEGGPPAGDEHEAEHTDPVTDAVDAAKDLADAGKGLLGVLGVGGAGTGAAAGGKALAAGGGAAAAGTGGVAKGALTTGAGAGTGAGTGGATGGAIGGSAVTGVSAGGAGGLVIVGIVVVIIICNEIAKAQQVGKTLQAKFRNLGRPSARALNEFEARLAALQWLNTPSHVEADPRLAPAYVPSEIRSAENETRSGPRVVYDYRTAPIPGGGNSSGLAAPIFARQARALAWDYLQARSEYCCRLNRNWERLPEPGWPLQSGGSYGAGAESLFGTWWNNPRLFDDIMPGLGGLAGVPLITGRTAEARGDKSSPDVPAAELRAHDDDQGIARGGEGVTATDVKLARLMGLITVLLWACRNVPGIHGHTDARVMSEVLKQRLELSPAEAVVENWTASLENRNASRWGLRLPASTWGLECRFDVMIAQSGAGEPVTEVA